MKPGLLRSKPGISISCDNTSWLLDYPQKWLPQVSLLRPGITRISTFPLWIPTSDAMLGEPGAYR
jgi:hypothetical protein